MAMTPLPAAPSRATPATFATLSDTFVAALPQFVTEANALQTDVTTRQSDVVTRQSDVVTRQTDVTTKQGLANTSATNAATSETNAATSAASALNAVGTSATSATSLTLATGVQSFTLAQTGKAYAVGQTVVIANTAAPSTNQMTGTITSFNSGTGAMVVNSTTFIGTGTFTAWTISLSGPQAVAPVVDVYGGALATSSVASITLTSTSKKVQLISMTAAGLQVNLPNATTLAMGGPIFVIRNTGIYPFAVRDSAGTLKCVVGCSQTATLHSADNTTSIGNWIVNNDSSSSSLGQMIAGVNTVLNSTFSGSCPTCAVMLTSTVGFYSSANGGGGRSISVITVTGTSVSIGTGATMNGGQDGTQMFIFPVSSTRALAVCGNNGGTGQWTAATVDVSGTTAVIGTPYTIVNSTSSAVGGVAVLSATRLVVEFSDQGLNAGNPRFLKVLDVSGTTISGGAAFSTSTATYPIQLIPVSNTRFGARQALASSVTFQTYNISGTTISVGSAATQESIGATFQTGIPCPSLLMGSGYSITAYALYTGSSIPAAIYGPTTVIRLMDWSSGTAVSLDYFEFHGSKLDGISLALINPTRFAISGYLLSGASNLLEVSIFDVVGNSIVFVERFTLGQQYGTSIYGFAVGATSGKAVVSYCAPSTGYASCRAIELVS